MILPLWLITSKPVTGWIVRFLRYVISISIMTQQPCGRGDTMFTTLPAIMKHCTHVPCLTFEKHSLTFNLRSILLRGSTIILLQNECYNRSLGSVQYVSIHSRTLLCCPLFSCSGDKTCAVTKITQQQLSFFKLSTCRTCTAFEEWHSSMFQARSSNLNQIFLDPQSLCYRNQRFSFFSQPLTR